MTAAIDDVCDYIVTRMSEAGDDLNHLKLQKLLYYVQAWHLAFVGTVLFAGGFQAWIHGPVNRDTYDRYKDQKMLYSRVGPKDVRPTFMASSLTEEQRVHIDGVLESYGEFSGTQLEDLTHHEAPWIEARDGYRDTERCEVLIKESTMRDFYRTLLPA